MQQCRAALLAICEACKPKVPRSLAQAWALSMPCTGLAAWALEPQLMASLVELAGAQDRLAPELLHILKQLEAARWEWGQATKFCLSACCLVWLSGASSMPQLLSLIVERVQTASYLLMSLTCRLLAEDGSDSAQVCASLDECAAQAASSSSSAAADRAHLWLLQRAQLHHLAAGAHLRRGHTSDACAHAQEGLTLAGAVYAALSEGASGSSSNSTTDGPGPGQAAGASQRSSSCSLVLWQASYQYLGSQLLAAEAFELAGCVEEATCLLKECRQLAASLHCCAAVVQASARLAAIARKQGSAEKAAALLLRAQAELEQGELNLGRIFTRGKRMDANILPQRRQWLPPPFNRHTHEMHIPSCLPALQARSSCSAMGKWQHTSVPQCIWRQALHAHPGLHRMQAHARSNSSGCARRLGQWGRQCSRRVCKACHGAGKPAHVSCGWCMHSCLPSQRMHSMPWRRQPQPLAVHLVAWPQILGLRAAAGPYSRLRCCWNMGGRC